MDNQQDNRNKKKREQVALKRKQETSAQRNRRLEKVRVQVALKRKKETPAQHRERLDREKGYIKNTRRSVFDEETEILIEAGREKGYLKNTRRSVFDEETEILIEAGVDCYTKEELEEMDQKLEIIIPSDISKREMYKQAQFQLGPQCMNDKPCAICEMDYPHKEITCVELSEVILSDMKRSIGLPIGHSYPPFVVMQYDASSIDSRLSGLLLFPKAIFRTNDVTILQMCKLCHLSLGQKKDLPPPLSIANGTTLDRGRPVLTLHVRDGRSHHLVASCVSE